MELKKELPEIFEEFADARKNSFLAIKELKEEGIPVVGVFCTYLPREIPHAMGASVVGLCSVTDETIPDAEKDLPRNLCPLIKSSYGFAKTDKCPFFYFSDLIVGETTCDGKKKMYEMLAEFKPVHVIELPNCQTEAGIGLYRQELIRFKEVLEKKFGTVITEDAIRCQIHNRNQILAALNRLQYVMALDPAPALGLDIVNIVYGTGFKMKIDTLAEEVNAITDKIEAEYAQGRNIGKRARILVTGSPSGGAALKVVRAIEDNGGVVVCFENCSGMKPLDPIDEDNPDVYDALARKYLNIGCSCMSPNPCGRRGGFGSAGMPHLQCGNLPGAQAGEGEEGTSLYRCGDRLFPGRRGPAEHKDGCLHRDAIRNNLSRFSCMLRSNRRFPLPLPPVSFWLTVRRCSCHYGKPDRAHGAPFSMQCSGRLM